VEMNARAGEVVGVSQPLRASRRAAHVAGLAGASDARRAGLRAGAGRDGAGAGRAGGGARARGGGRRRSPRASRGWPRCRTTRRRWCTSRTRRAATCSSTATSRRDRAAARELLGRTTARCCRPWPSCSRRRGAGARARGPVECEEELPGGADGPRCVLLGEVPAAPGRRDDLRDCAGSRRTSRGGGRPRRRCSSSTSRSSGGSPSARRRPRRRRGPRASSWRA
jgi:hypothetical protein